MSSSADIHDSALQYLAGPCELAVPLDELGLNRVRIEHALGYNAREVPEPIPDLIEQALSEARYRLTLRGGYRILPPEAVRLEPDALHLDGVRFDVGELIAGLLDTAATFAVFVATAGPGLDDWTRELFGQGDLMTGYVVDAVGSVAAERACAWLEEHLADTVDALGWSVTAQYGPGYCGWRLSEQHKLFRLLPPGTCGITLSESALMHPVKSVSGVIGMGPNAVRRAHGCSVCTLTTCFRRMEAGFRG